MIEYVRILNIRGYSAWFLAQLGPINSNCLTARLCQHWTGIVQYVMLFLVIRVPFYPCLSKLFHKTYTAVLRSEGSLVEYIFRNWEMRRRELRLLGKFIGCCWRYVPVGKGVGCEHWLVAWFFISWFLGLVHQMCCTIPAFCGTGCGKVVLWLQ